jgi:ribosome-binding protein aMBF1 (putative translation factor)
MTAQFLDIAGQKMAMLPMADYERLLEIVEDQADINAAVTAEKRRVAGEDYIPAALVYRIMDGENALRAWRQHRNLTLSVLAGKTGTTQSMLSRIESGQLQGRPALWRKLADALGVTIDDILPLDNPQ